MLWMKWEKCLQSLWLSYVNDVICSRVMNDYKMPCLVSLIWVLKEEAKTIWVCWLYSWINLLCKKWNSRWELGLILWKWKHNKKRIDWRERQRNKRRELKKNREWIMIRRFLLFVDRLFEFENELTTHDLEQTDYLNELDIRTSASNKRFKSNSI